jgi:hypothetical protein
VLDVVAELDFRSVGLRVAVRDAVLVPEGVKLIVDTVRLCVSEPLWVVLGIEVTVAEADLDVMLDRLIVLDPVTESETEPVELWLSAFDTVLV